MANRDNHDIQMLKAVQTIAKNTQYLSTYNQIKWERDIAISQLNAIGVELGRDMTDIKAILDNAKGEEK